MRLITEKIMEQNTTGNASVADPELGTTMLQLRSLVICLSLQEMTRYQAYVNHTSRDKGKRATLSCARHEHMNAGLHITLTGSRCEDPCCNIRLVRSKEPLQTEN
jgi:hypothetical protein